MEPNSPLYIDTNLKCTSKEHDKNETLPNITKYYHIWSFNL